VFQVVARDAAVAGYSIKPLVLIDALKKAKEAIWLDADIIVTAPILSSEPTVETLVVAEEPWSEAAPHVDRCTPWGLCRARRLSATVNTCVVRATIDHLPLLGEWLAFLTTDEFRAAQKFPWQTRPRHASGDQEVLDALLCSDKYCNVPVKFLHCGRDIAQCFFEDGYSFVERLSNIRRRLPPLVHCQGIKPWLKRGARPVYLDVSPYNYAARIFENQVIGDITWMYPHTCAGRILDILTFKHPSLAGAFPAAAKRLARIARLRTRLRRLRPLRPSA
jgi:hypothetical protein